MSNTEMDHRPHAGGYNYKPINSRTYFTGGLP